MAGLQIPQHATINRLYCPRTHGATCSRHCVAVSSANGLLPRDPETFWEIRAGLALTGSSHVG